MTKNSEVVAALEREWDLEGGFLGTLRMGNYDEGKMERFLKTIEAIPEPKSDEDLNRRLISLLWYIPFVMDWNRNLVRSGGGNLDVFDNALCKVQAKLERVLGVP